MRIGLIVLIAALALAAGVGYWQFNDAEAPARYRLAKVESGLLVSAVTTSGVITPLVTVVVGSQLSGQLRELLADFNKPVKAGEVLARLDTDLLRAKQAQAEADLASAKATLEVERAQAEGARADILNARAAVANAKAQAERAEIALGDAEREMKRKQGLRERGVVGAVDTDRAETAFASGRAQLTASRAQEAAAQAGLAAAEAALRVSAAKANVAEAQVAQRQAQLRQVQVDLERSEIRAPIDGVVVSRSIDVGQTVAASLTAPTLFTIAQDLREIEVHASVDEADIGRVQIGQAVTFTVTAHPQRNFDGQVKQIRLGAQTLQNVVTYTVVIAAENRQQLLLPGMTANARIVIEQREQALKVPNAALRYRPPAGSAAAPQSANGTPDVASAGFGPQALDQMAGALTRHLKLNAAQQQGLKDILEDARREFAQLATADPGVRANRMRALRGVVGDRIADIMDSEQRAKYAALRQARQASPATTGQVHVLGADAVPRPVAVRLGIGDGAFTEVLSGSLSEGQEVIVGGGRPPTPAARPGAGSRLGF
ncbi:MAG: efflux RND transporter periplasmic adaptor subunit [Alphaproteobacteria bacterium]|nr:efflux RND transporter periplasmic adaptor subunit [Alphaproteobacteria bacterium]